MTSPLQVGEEATGDAVDDPWPKPGGSRGSAAQELPDALHTVLLDEVLPLTARELWRLVMADPAFFRHMQAQKKVSELHIGRWQLSGSALPLLLQPLHGPLGLHGQLHLLWLHVIGCAMTGGKWWMAL